MLTQLLNNVYAVEVPSMAFGFDINNYGSSSELMFMIDIADITDDPALQHDETIITKPLTPPGNWLYLFTTKGAKEEDWKGVVGKFHDNDGIPGYYNYLDNMKTLWNTSNESGHSLLKSKNLDPTKNYCLLLKNDK